MATGQQFKLTRSQQRLADLLRANPEFTRPVDLKQAFSREYNKRVGHNDVRFVLENRDAILSSSAKVDEEEDEIVETFVPESMETPTPAESAFVPTLLMDTIADVSSVIQQAGGFNNARDVAGMVERVGGVANFMMALSLLEKIPSRPQVPAPSHMD